MADEKDIGITGEAGEVEGPQDALPGGGAADTQGDHNHDADDKTGMALTPKKGVLSGLVKKAPEPEPEDDPLPFIRQLEEDLKKEDSPEGEDVPGPGPGDELIAPEEAAAEALDLAIDDIPNDEFENEPDPPAVQDEDDDIGWATKEDSLPESETENSGWQSGPVIVQELLNEPDPGEVSEELPQTNQQVDLTVSGSRPESGRDPADIEGGEEGEEEVGPVEDTIEEPGPPAEAFRSGFDSGRFSNFSPVPFDVQAGAQEQAPVPGPAQDNAQEAAEIQSVTLEAPPEPAAEVYEESPSVRVDRFLSKVILDSYSAHRLLAHDDVSALYVGKGINVVGHVAIKVSKFKRSDDAREFVQEIRDRSLEHPGIARLLEAESDDSGLAFIVFEYPECITLAELLEGVGRIDKEEDIAGVLIQLADAFVSAHEIGIYHGSVSAGKVLLLESKGSIAVRVLDFGSPVLFRERCNYIGGGKKLVSPQYMSPEIIDGFDPGAQSDIYSIGVIAYQLITGALPYPDENSDEIIAAHRDPETMPDPVTKIRPDLINNQQLSQLVYEAMETDPDWRFDAIREFRDGIEGWINSVRETKAARAAAQVSEPDSKFDVTGYDEIMTARQSERDLKTSILNMVALKQKSMEQEQTVVIQLTDKFKIGGQRQSPVRTLLTVVGITVLVVGIVGGGLFYASGHQEELGAAWMSASRQLSGLLHKGAPGDEEKLEDTLETMDDSLGREEDGAKKPGTTTGAAGTNLPGGGTTTAPPPVRRAVRKFRYEESPIYKDYVPKSKGSDPVIIK